MLKAPQLELPYPTSSHLCRSRSRDLKFVAMKTEGKYIEAQGPISGKEVSHLQLQ